MNITYLQVVVGRLLLQHDKIDTWFQAISHNCGQLCSNKSSMMTMEHPSMDKFATYQW